MHWPPFDTQKHPTLSILIIKPGFFKGNWMHSSPSPCSSLFFLIFMQCLLFILKNKTKKLECRLRPVFQVMDEKYVTDVIWRALNRPPWTPKLFPNMLALYLKSHHRYCSMFSGMALYFRGSPEISQGMPTQQWSIIKPLKAHNNPPTTVRLFPSHLHHWCFAQCSKSQTACVSLLLLSRFLAAY